MEMASRGFQGQLVGWVGTTGRAVGLYLGSNQYRAINEYTVHSPDAGLQAGPVSSRSPMSTIPE